MRLRKIMPVATLNAFAYVVMNFQLFLFVSTKTVITGAKF